MEKFRIAQYGCMQMVALAYGILSTSLINKGARHLVADGQALAPQIKAVVLFHDYGFFLSIFIIGWAAYCAYHISGFANWKIEEGAIVASGLVLSGLYLILSTVLLFMTLGSMVSV